MYEENNQKLSLSQEELEEKERLRQNQAEYRRKNRDRILQNQKRYREKNKEKISEERRRKYQETGGQYHKDYYQ